MCPGLRLEGLRQPAHPVGGTECRGQAQCPAFAPGSSEVAVLADSSRTCPDAQLLLVPCGFFAFCCWRRGESRCKHRGKGFQEPACLDTSAWPGCFLMLSAHEQPSFEDRRSDAPTSLGPLEQILHSDRNHLDKQAPLSSLELPWTALQFNAINWKVEGLSYTRRRGLPMERPEARWVQYEGLDWEIRACSARLCLLSCPMTKGGNGKHKEAEEPGRSVSRCSGTIGKAPSMPSTNPCPCGNWILLEKLCQAPGCCSGCPWMVRVCEKREPWGRLLNNFRN